MGPPALISVQKEGVLPIFIALKNPSPLLGSNTQTFGPVASTVTTTLSRRLAKLLLRDFVCWMDARFYTAVCTKSLN
jgi:hypothetical protein